jgi:hypothetical protein
MRDVPSMQFLIRCDPAAHVDNPWARGETQALIPDWIVRLRAEKVALDVADRSGVVCKTMMRIDFRFVESSYLT